MTMQEIMKRIIEQRDDTAPGDLLVPPLELVAFNVRFARKMRQLKLSSLAHMAGVSVSTIERVERAEKVSDDALDKIAVAFGLEPGYYTAPRRRLSTEEAGTKALEQYSHLVEVDVRPLRTQTQVRKIGRCHCSLLSRPSLGAAFDDDIAGLMEWLQIASPSLDMCGDKSRRRELYQAILKAAANVERNLRATVLVGTMAAPQPILPEWTVAIILITPRDIDPGALKRRFVLVDRRCTQLNLPIVELKH